MKKLATLTILAFTLLNGCGGGETSSSALKTISSLKTTTTLDSSNYIKIAKSIYALKSGKKSNIILLDLPAPGKTLNKDAMYLKKIVKPRDYKISEIEVQYGTKVLSIIIDKKYKYATVKLITDEIIQEVIDMKEFTTIK